MIVVSARVVVREIVVKLLGCDDDDRDGGGEL